MPASTVTEYLAALPADRRDALNEDRRGINRALPAGYKAGIQFGMISQIPCCTARHSLPSPGSLHDPLPIQGCAQSESPCAGPFIFPFPANRAVPVAPAKALMVDLPHASIHRD